jgi:murein DD-endopeptidase MepM/ murein hydrolase activator NlpD
MANPKTKAPRQAKPQSQKKRPPQGGEEEGKEKKKSFFSKVMEGGCLAAALTILIFLGLVVIAILALISVLGTLGFADRPALYGNVPGGGGYVIDSAFPAVKNVSATDVMGKLSRYDNLKGKQTQVQMIIDKSRAAGINYYLLLDIWAAEQTFGNDSAAMGCGVYGGANRASGFENQVDCAISTIKKTLTNTAPYNEPAGQNYFTRLFYNYTAGMQDRYKQLGYVAECNDTRLVIHRLLAQEEVVCSAAGGGDIGPGVPQIGDKLYPPLAGKQGNGSTYANHATFHRKDDSREAVDYGAPIGTPVYAITDGTIERYYPYTHKDYGPNGQVIRTEYRGYNINFRSSDGKIYAIYAHLVPAGRLNPNGQGENITGIKKGEKIATIFDYPGSSHLHFELNILGSWMGIVGGKNYQLDYFGSVK